MPVPPPTAVGPALGVGAADRCGHTESGGHLQCVRSHLFSEETAAGTVARMDEPNRIC